MQRIYRAGVCGLATKEPCSWNILSLALLVGLD